MGTELRLALRQAIRHRGFALTVVSTLALTVGATTAVFSVVQAVLVRGLPFASPERLVWVASVRPDNTDAPFTLPEFMDYRSRTRTLSGLAAYANWSASLAGEGVTQRLQGARMSANLFDVLGVAPAAGRLLHESDDRPEAAAVVVLSHRLWQREYGGGADIVGRTARINGQSFVIVGVLPRQFPLPLRDVDIATPLVPDRDPSRHVRSSVNFLRFVGRLSDETGAAQAQSELTAIGRSLRLQFPVEYAGKDSVKVVPLQETLVAGHRTAMLALFAAVIVVLATTLANLVSLALVRAQGRRAELSMRIALGASRPRLARQLAAESLLLAGMGSGLGWLAAIPLVRTAVRFAPASVPRLDEVRLDGTSILVVLAVTAVVTVLLTAAPLGTIARTSSADPFSGASRGAIGNRWNRRVRNAMVVAEISAALVLVLATILLVQGLGRLQDVHPGFRPDGVFQARVSIPPSYRSAEDVSRFDERVTERLASSPGVRQVGVISVAPLSSLLYTVPFSVSGQPAEPDRPSANLRAISPGYLPAVGTRILQGRPLSESDGPHAPAVALVSAALAERFLSGHAVGRQLLIDDNDEGPRPVEVVGVVENVRQAALDLPPAFDVYIPLPQMHPDGVSSLRGNQFWMVRTESDPAAFRQTFLAHLRAVDPDAAVSDTGTMRRFLEASLGPRRFSLGLFAAFASTAVLLAVLGLYGLVSYAVAQRTAEIGLRMAIGATGGDVQRMILRQAAGIGAAGAAAGLSLAVAARLILARTIQDARFPLAIAAATAAALMGVVLAAAWLPARRAARIEPTIALRGG